MPQYKYLLQWCTDSRVQTAPNSAFVEYLSWIPIFANNIQLPTTPTVLSQRQSTKRSSTSALPDRQVRTGSATRPLGDFSTFFFFRFSTRGFHVGFAPSSFSMAPNFQPCEIHEILHVGASRYEYRILPALHTHIHSYAPHAACGIQVQCEIYVMWMVMASSIDIDISTIICNLQRYRTCRAAVGP